MLFLSRNEVESLLDLDQLIESLAPAMAELSAGAVSMPARGVVQIGKNGGLLAAMPVYLPLSQTLSTKLVSVFPGNERLGLPSHQAVVLVFDSKNGTPLAMMDGASITAIRTAAGSALATRLLSRPESQVLTLLGTGVQARAHAKAITRVRRVREVRVWGRSRQKFDALVKEQFVASGVRARAVPELKQALAGAEIICACTHSAEPVVMGEWLARGAHVNSVGLNAQGREVDEAAILNGLVVVESRDAALAPAPSGANDLTWPIQQGIYSRGDIHAEIGELVSGTRPGRTSPEQITIYKSVGVAVQDAVAARLVLEAARERGVGKAVHF
ncbi:MAG TPA: ornithine cyclodeaminase family protein [Terriglobia bacterium]|nr:ornithine cyclodeaminase family protein [Terriglobia bacterium]